MHQKRWAAVIAIISVIAVVAAAIFVMRDNFVNKTYVRIGDAVLNAQILNTESARKKGLSGKSGLGQNEAALFVFDSEDKWGMWMKNMNFNIDIIWLSSDKKVVDVKEDVSPDTYPDTFVPKVDAKYVLEVVAGTVQTKNINPGATAQFDIN